jgi:hypothetical protein
MLATNEYFSVGGGFVVNKETQTAENLYYRDINLDNAAPSRRNQTHRASSPSIEVPQIPGPSEETPVAPLSASIHDLGAPSPDSSRQLPHLFATAAELHEICMKYNLTIAQVVWENELVFRSEDEIRAGLLKRTSRRSQTVVE